MDPVGNILSGSETASWPSSTSNDPGFMVEQSLQAWMGSSSPGPNHLTAHLKVLASYRTSISDHEGHSASVDGSVRASNAIMDNPSFIL
jgi:hypothetical protein